MTAKGKTEVTLEVRNGRTFARRKVFYENGRLASEGLFSLESSKWESDIPCGRVATYYPSGQLSSEQFYDEFGNADGEFTFFYEDGTLARKLTFQKDRKIREEVFEKPYTNLPIRKNRKIA